MAYQPFKYPYSKPPKKPRGLQPLSDDKIKEIEKQVDKEIGQEFRAIGCGVIILFITFIAIGSLFLYITKT